MSLMSLTNMATGMTIKPTQYSFIKRSGSMVNRENENSTNAVMRLVRSNGDQSASSYSCGFFSSTTQALVSAS